MIQFKYINQCRPNCVFFAQCIYGWRLLLCCFKIILLFNLLIIQDYCSWSMVIRQNIWHTVVRAAPSCDILNLGSSYFHVPLTAVRHLLNVVYVRLVSSVHCPFNSVIQVACAGDVNYGAPQHRQCRRSTVIIILFARVRLPSFQLSRVSLQLQVGRSSRGARLWDVSYTSFDARNDDSYTGRERVEM